MLEECLAVTQERLRQQLIRTTVPVTNNATVILQLSSMIFSGVIQLQQRRHVPIRARAQRLAIFISRFNRKIT